MSEEWKTFKEEQPKQGQFILVCLEDVKPDYLESYPYPFKFEFLSNNCNCFNAIEGRRGQIITYTTIGVVWRDMIKLPGEK